MLDFKVMIFKKESIVIFAQKNRNEIYYYDYQYSFFYDG